MKTRKELLFSLLSLSDSVPKLVEELLMFGYDSKDNLIIAKGDDIIKVLLKCINNQIDINKIEEWANALEYRDDIDYEKPELREFIFELANTEINGKITKNRLLEIIENIDNKMIQ